MSYKKIIFVSATRADYSKQKNLIKLTQKKNYFKTYIFVSGMHTMKKYGETWRELKKDKIKNLYKFSNQQSNTSPNDIFKNTFNLFRKFCIKVQPDLVILHGDRIETLACAVSCSLNNIKIGHIEGGELSGTLDEMIRHSVSKLSNHHFVSNKISKNRLIQMGENKNDISIIGSPDLDIALSKNLPNISQVKQRYAIKFNNYSILLFHPVFSEVKQVKIQIINLLKASILSKLNFVIILPNNDLGSNIIHDEILKLKKNNNFKIIKSMRFEFYLTLLKFSQFIIGNSSSGIIEAPYTNTFCINVGSRQNKRISKNPLIINTNYQTKNIFNAIKLVLNQKNRKKKINTKYFGNGRSAELFVKKLKDKNLWKKNTQKYFIDFINK